MPNPGGPGLVPPSGRQHPEPGGHHPPGGRLPGRPPATACWWPSKPPATFWATPPCTATPLCSSPRRRPIWPSCSCIPRPGGAGWAPAFWKKRSTGPQREGCSRMLLIKQPPAPVLSKRLLRQAGLARTRRTWPTSCCPCTGRRAVTKPIVIGARLRRYPQFITLGPRPNLDDYPPEHLELIREASVVYYPTEILAPQLAAMGKRLFPSLACHLLEGDKIKQTTLFKLLGLPHPRTRVFYGNQRREILEHFAFPFVAKKPRASSRGRGGASHRKPSPAHGLPGREQGGLHPGAPAHKPRPQGGGHRL